MQAGLGRGRGAWGPEGRTENRETWAGPTLLLLLLFSLSMFSRKFQEGQPMLLVKRMNKTKHWEPFAMPKVVRISCSYSCSCSLFSDDSLPSSNVTANGQRRQPRRSDATWIHVSTIFLVLVHAPVARCRLSGPKHCPSTRRLSPKRYRSENISYCRHFGNFIWETEWEQVVPIEWSVHASELPWGP